MRSVRLHLLASLLSILLAGTASAVEVDLAEFPDGGGPVANGTVLSDQYRSLGILFSARIDGGNPIQPIVDDFGTSLKHIFFTPDLFGAVAVFDFVEPGTTTTADAAHFQLDVYFDPGESATLVALDGSGTVVDEDGIDGAAGGDATMTVTGTFRRVEWRTEGNPGIAGKLIEFTLADDPPDPPGPPAETPCATAPIAGCRTAAKASLSWSEKRAGNERAAIALRGFDTATARTDFGDPAAGNTRYAVCLYGATGQRVAELVVDRAGASCGPKQKPCWKAKKSTGWRYADPSGTASGVTGITAAAGAAGKGHLVVKGANKSKKGLTALPTRITAALQGATSVRVQVVTLGAGCFEATLASVKKADGSLVKAKKP